MPATSNAKATLSAPPLTRANPIILDIWHHIEPRFGGIGPAASALATAVDLYNGSTGHQIAVCDYGEKKLADGINPHVKQIENRALRGWADYDISNALYSVIAAADVCHVHGLWVPHSLAARRISAKLAKPIVSSAHGQLETWEIHNKKLKKAIYSFLFERPSLARSMCLRALSEREVADYHRFGVRKPIAIVPNGINALEPVDTGKFLTQFPQLRSKAIVLFLGRVYRKKGVLNLIRAWQLIAGRHQDAHLVIAGPEYEDTGLKARDLISELELEKSVTMLGVVSGHTKLATLSASKYFCLPSYSEGLSVAVLEALSIGLPAIITPECNMTSVESSGAGVVTLNDPVNLAQAIHSCLSLGSREWQEMSVAARKLARTKYAWETTGAAMNGVYEWLLGGDKPSCVVT